MIDDRSFERIALGGPQKTSQAWTSQEKTNFLIYKGDLLTQGHLKRTSFCVKEIALELYREGKEPNDITLSYVTAISGASVLHDIGKLSLPQSLLSKPKSLTPEEFEIVKTHAEKGAEMIEKIIEEEGHRDALLSLAAAIARSHHEWWDGRGYPRGQKGKDIPLGGRITAVADVFDALVSPRPYKKAYSADDAVTLIIKESGTHFDPEVVSAFAVVKDDIVKRYSKWAQGC